MALFKYFQPINSRKTSFKLVEIMKKLAFWMSKKNYLIWFILLIYIFILSNDYWNWNKSNPIILGLPLWMIYFIILTLLTSFAFYLFSKYYWSDNSD